VFALFTTAALADKRSLPALTKLLAENPPWRTAYFEHLYADADAAAIVAALVVNLEKTKAPMSTPELQRLYMEWTTTRRFAGLRFLRGALQRPPMSLTVANGDFQTPAQKQFYPFGWRADGGPGVFVAFVEEDAAPDNFALRVEYDGFSSTGIAEQLVLLDAGAYTLSGSQKFEAATTESHLEWNLTCAETGRQLARYKPTGVADRDVGAWTSFSVKFDVPASQCSAQWLRLSPVPGAGRRRTLISWFDSIQLRRTGTISPADGS
jgi:hypothetical protein